MFKLRNREVLFCDENLPQNRLLDQDQPIEQNRIEKYFYSVYSIEWGLNNRDYDFKGVWGQKPYTNDEILKFMKMEYDWCIARLEKEGLLEDYKGFKSILSSTPS